MTETGEQRSDWCPECGLRRTELVVAPDRFYCHGCGVAGPGPNDDPPQVPGQLTLEEAVGG